MAEEVTPHIVEGVAAMTAVGGLEKSDIAIRVERAMAQAVERCYSVGVTDPDKVREAMLAARDEITG